MGDESKKKFLLLGKQSKSLSELKIILFRKISVNSSDGPYGLHCKKKKQVNWLASSKITWNAKMKILTFINKNFKLNIHIQYIFVVTQMNNYGFLLNKWLMQEENISSNYSFQ